MTSVERLKSGKFRIRKRIEGKTYSVMVDHRPGMREAERLIDEAVAGTPKDPAPGLTVGEACDAFEAVRYPVLSPATRRGYEICRRAIPEGLLVQRLSVLTEPGLQLVVNDWIRAGASEKTVKNRLGYLSAVASLSGVALPVRAVVVTRQQEAREIRCPEDSEVRAVLEALRGSQFEIAVRLACYGLRRSEICALKKEDLDQAGVLHIRRALVPDPMGYYQTKGTKTRLSARDVLIDEELAGMIRAARKPYEGNPNSITRALKRACRACGVEPFTLHGLRHFFASRAHEMGIPAAQIQRSGGWSSSYTMDKVYRHARISEMQKSQAQYAEIVKEISGAVPGK